MTSATLNKRAAGSGLDDAQDGLTSPRSTSVKRSSRDGRAAPERDVRGQRPSVVAMVCAARSARAAMVSVGFAAPPVGKTPLPSR